MRNTVIPQPVAYRNYILLHCAMSNEEPPAIRRGVLLSLLCGRGCGRYLCSRSAHSGGLIKRLNAIGADFSSLAIYFSPLKVRIASVFCRRVIMATQKDSGGNHDWFFATLWTACCHVFSETSDRQ